MPQIIPIKDLKNTSAVSEMCHQLDEPVYITKNGYGDMVIMSMEHFDRLNERMQIYDALNRSEHDIQDGCVKDARESLASMRAHYGL